MEYKVTNNKTGHVSLYSKKNLKNKFETDSWVEKHYLKKNFDLLLQDCDEEDREYILNSHLEVYENEDEYLKDMVEYETWCSPRGVESLYRLEICNKM